MTWTGRSSAKYRKAAGDAARRTDDAAGCRVIAGTHNGGVDQDFLARIGPRLLWLRESRGWSLAELAGRTGLSRPYLSRLETSERQQPSLAGLLTLASAYDMSLAQLLDFTGSVQTSVIRGSESTSGSAEGMAVELLSKGGQLDALRLSVDVQQEDDAPYSHPGEEWLYVLSGQLRLLLNEDAYVLDPGDAAHFAGSVPHLHRATRSTAEFLLVTQGATRCEAGSGTG